MQVQVQTLVRKDELTQKDVDDLDLFVGLHSPLNSPYNIFLRLKDLENNNTIIYFYAYSLGEQKVLLWGIYDRSTNEFMIDDACKYNPNDLKYILDTWKNNNYEFFFTAMRNRMTSRITQYQIYGDDKNKMAELADSFKKEYLRRLVSLGSLSDKIRSKIESPEYKIEPQSNIKFDLRSNHGNIDYDSLLVYVYNAGAKAVGEGDFKPTLKLLLDEVDTMEDEEVVENIITTNLWVGTEYHKNVAKHILVHLFLMTFLTVDDYRVAKYIDYIHNQPEDNEKLMKYLKGSFLYEWLLELGKSMRIYNLDRFIKNIANDILRLTEENINMTNVGVIGGPRITGQIGVLMENLSSIFEDFISKSMYSKISYANNLTPCPSIKSCENGEEKCELYSHGYTTTSKYDLT